jgi:protein-disulfide isomerase
MFRQDTSPETDQSPQPAPLPPAPRSNRKWIVFGIAGCAVLLCVALVVGLGAFILVDRQMMTAPQPTVQALQVPVTLLPEPTLAALMHTQPPGTAQQPPNSMGNPNAPVKIIEFADFQCPYCRQFWQETEPQVVEQYVKTGKVYYEYHSAGAFLGPESGAAAQAAYCAGDQGKFWQYHDTLFSHWTGENVGDFTNDKLLQYAASLGMDKGLFSDCLNSSKYAPMLDQDGIRATPSFLINGKLVEGFLPFADFQQAIETALNGK